MNLDRTRAASGDEQMSQALHGLLAGVGRLSRTLFEIGGFELPRSSVGVLAALEDEPLRVTDLPPLVGLTQPRVTTVLHDLHERGLVEKHRSTDDRRVVRVQLTAAGRDLLRDSRERTAAVLLDGLRSHVDDPGEAVAAARKAVVTLLDALESEAR
ncbi:putative transcriptional regulator [Actinacidiphila reveromycinica]|uniref:Putative transcriptional regulator n=1 Tax=Actinacidiphila reveromycinica TaxID=659352 RepID=A0A7U3UUG1_9ACTN|nr:MarR family transcriptional regulator [Streptomyces sp. SN-593]BBA98978.1 putative transcriptional regulator [Streptomyces sp. SN-593]